MKTAAHGSMTQLKGTRAVLEDRVKKARGGKTSANIQGWRWARGSCRRDGKCSEGSSQTRAVSQTGGFARIQTAPANGCVSCGRLVLRSGPGRRRAAREAGGARASETSQQQDCSQGQTKISGSSFQRLREWNRSRSRWRKRSWKIRKQDWPHHSFFQSPSLLSNSWTFLTEPLL